MTGALALPPALADLLPALAMVFAGALVMATIAAIRQFRPKPPSIPAPAREERPPAPAPTGFRAAAVRLAALRDPHDGIAGIPLMVTIGSASADLRRFIPALRSGDLARAERDLFVGDCRFSVCPDGAVVSFDDGLLQSERAEARWAALLKGLATIRADRPFDGLVVMLDAGALHGPGRWADDRIVALGERLHQLIWMAQRAGGWRVPIYLVLTGCECLTGFTATLEAMMKEAPLIQQAPFGWAVPYALESMFERRWVQNGIDALVSRLSLAQAPLLVRATETAAAEQILLFPEAVAALEEPLAQVLTPMLQPSAYHEAFMFRGFYLTGGATPDGGTEPAAFAAKLFHDRIFPEHTLAQPALGATTRRRRQIRMAQAGLAVLAILMAIGLAVIEREQSAIASVQPLVAASLDIASEVSMKGIPNLAEQAAVTRKLLSAMSGVGVNSIESVWAPLSLLSGADNTVTAAIRGAYEHVILREVRGRLASGEAVLPGNFDARAVAACAGSSAPSANGVPAGGVPADGIAQMQQIVARLAQYPQQITFYHQLRNHPEIDALKRLLGFSLAVALPDSFETDNYLYLVALKQAQFPPLSMPRLRENIGRILACPFANALASAYGANPLARAVARVVEASRGMSPSPSWQGAADHIRALGEALRAAETEAAQGKHGWLIDETEIAPIAAILAQLRRLASSSESAGQDTVPIDPETVAAFAKQAASAATDARSSLLAATVFGGTKVLAVEGGAVTLSPPLVAIRKTIDALLSLPLMTTVAPPADLGRALAAGLPPVWDDGDLRMLQLISEGFLVFVAQSLANEPALFQAQVLAAGGEQLARLLAGAMVAPNAGAAASGGAAALHADIAHFAEAAPVLANMREALRATGQIANAARIDQLVAEQAVGLLARVDAILLSADPYQLADRSLSFWTGAPPLAAPAFGASSLADLVGTLPARRDYVETLARDYAAPLINYLAQSAALLAGNQRALQERWQGIIATLDRYHANDPANALSQLEQFIAADMDQIDLANCRQRLAGGGGGNWFADQLGTIRNAVARRCASVSYSDLVAQYGELATAFNRDLAGRFPFGDAAAPDAFAGDVKRFFDRFGPDLATLATRLAATPAYARAGADAFVASLVAAQAALAPMLLNPAPDAPLTYEVAVDFRTNAGSDPGADQVAEASLQFGQQTLSSFAAPAVLAWSNGQPATIAVRWATNAPSIPAGGGVPNPSVNGLVASYRFGGAWALLRLITTLAPPPGVLMQLSDRRPETIGLQINLKPNPAAATGGDTRVAVARLFMRIGLTAIIHMPGAPDKRVPVLLPVFPTAAPLPPPPSLSSPMSAPRALPKAAG